jgi:crotonobetainyl-CoA:carnitine CoA-transferase CaiB-like acyl-CoA transferase
MAETDALVEGWASARTRDEIFLLTQEHRVPSAPVRDLNEVMANTHMRERGMLEEIDHPRLGRITVPNSPLRYGGTEQMKTVASPELGQHNDEVYGAMLGLKAVEIAGLRSAGVI